MLAVGDVVGAGIAVAAFVLGLLVGVTLGRRRHVHLSIDVDDAPS